MATTKGKQNMVCARHFGGNRAFKSRVDFLLDSYISAKPCHSQILKNLSEKLFV